MAISAFVTCRSSGRANGLAHTAHRPALVARAAEAAAPQVPPGQKFLLTLPKPMGMVLGESSDKFVKVEELAKGGRAERAGVQVGDIVLEVSAVTLTAGKEGLYEKNGYGDRPFDNFNRSMMSCIGQDFDTVMNAIASNNERWGFRDVEIIILRPESA
eukprot:jgi/Ulvmu1/12113/UM084_0039.1